MTTKLTLTVEKSVIEKAKKYAKGTQRSLSEMVQKYLESLGEPEIINEPTPKMKKLLEKIPNNTPQYTDEELDNIRREYLEKKYL
ncbi:DUF6364 family protein [Epilithonimonas sp. JDS]|uniref:DUF6364 family protein n=1 Tax=Epilithonimonas sp. JDS TaxID=2902797 RepID=UPI001E438C01|nr:DUF6364 family protein [Epilithonimonas sp. JDS]MCD9855651.1 DUF6364 family protein [Epilithonimonas sp. JDS]